MTPEAQRIAIAEVCPNLMQAKSFIWSNQGFLVHPFNEIIIDPLNDLNAMHQAEKALTPHQLEWCDAFLKRAVYKSTTDADWEEGVGPTPATKYWHATATQRAEAFLRTLNLWKD